ncbi:MAG: hypothetical protein ABGX00_01620 [Allomuricauda sp.]
MALLLFSGCQKESRGSQNKVISGTEILPRFNESNFLRYTEDFSDESWAKVALEIQNNAALDPNGNPNADLVDFASNMKESRLSQTIQGLKEGYYAFSIYLKATEGDSGEFTISAHSKSLVEEWRNATIRLNDSTWERVDVRVYIKGRGSVTVYAGNNRVKKTENNIKRLYMWGAQLEKLSLREDKLSEYGGNYVLK